ncbi:MAG TPA: hypothetical protein ENG87_02815 [Candidatus Pacearchaeota archaeon]|nr:hypothetical protein [Candidatus Pacearchaeota archaeon]
MEISEKEEKEISEKESEEIAEDLKSVDDGCPPCKILAAAGLMIGQYCHPESKECINLAGKVINGKMTLRELGEELSAEEDFLGILESEGVELDTTLIAADNEEKDSDELDSNIQKSNEEEVNNNV